MTKETRIFKNLANFKRFCKENPEYKGNGFDRNFIKSNPKYEAENETNTLCFNCKGCTNCFGCCFCKNSNSLTNCSRCNVCTTCIDCHNCALCGNCIQCYDCVCCYFCNNSHGAKRCYECSDLHPKTSLTRGYNLYELLIRCSNMTGINYNCVECHNCKDMRHSSYCTGQSNVDMHYNTFVHYKCDE